MSNPTHYLIRDGVPEIVYPDGYAESSLTLLPEDFWNCPKFWNEITESFEDDIQLIKDAKLRLIMAKTNSIFLGGYNPATPNMVGHNLQVRDNDDRTNWLTSQAAYSAAVTAGAGSVFGAQFRTTANETVTVTYQEGLDVLLGMASWGAAIMATSWALKDALKSATTVPAIDDVDIEGAPWPE